MSIKKPEQMSAENTVDEWESSKLPDNQDSLETRVEICRESSDNETGSNLNDNGGCSSGKIPPYRTSNADAYSMRLFKSLDPSFKSNGVPRLLQNTSVQQANFRVNKKLASLCPKPKNLSGESECKSLLPSGVEYEDSSEQDGTDPDSNDLTIQSLTGENDSTNADNETVPSDEVNEEKNIECAEISSNQGVTESTDSRVVDEANFAEGTSGIECETETIDLEKDRLRKEFCSNKDLCAEPLENVQHRLVDLKEKPFREELIINSLHSCKEKNLDTLSVSVDGLEEPEEQVLLPKLKGLLNLLEQNPCGVDIKLSLFMSACAHDPRTLRPFPHKIMDDNEANRKLLYYIAEEIPNVSMLSFCLKQREVEMRKELVPVVNWLLRSEDPRLELVNENEYKSILGSVSDTSDLSNDIIPSKIFCIKTRRRSEGDELWRSMKREFKTRLAYHDCIVEQAHSILSDGLHNLLYKNGPMGTGIYMTDNLSSCLNNCLPACTWGKSSIATKLKLAFIVEFILNHNVMTYQGHELPFNNDIVKCECSTDTSNFFTRKPKLVKLRYLLVYPLEPSKLPTNPFLYAPIRRKLIKYLGIFRLSLLIATVIMGARASQNNASSPWFFELVNGYYDKISKDFQSWSIWNYVETPYLVLPFNESPPYYSSNII